MKMCYSLGMQPLIGLLPSNDNYPPFKQNAFRLKEGISLKKSEIEQKLT